MFFQNPYLPSGVTDRMIDEALGDYGDLPEKYCVCEHCENYDGPWMVCLLKCKEKGIDTSSSKTLDKAFENFEDEDFERLGIAKDYDDSCDDFEYDGKPIYRYSWEDDD